MPVPMQITIRDIAESEAIENRIREKVEKLGQFYSHIVFCRIVVDVPEKRQHQGKLFNVRIEIAVPGKELVVKRDLHEDLYVSIRDAFKDAVRQLEEYAAIQRGDVKAHQETLVGRVVRLFPEGEYGFIETPYGEEYYFNNSMLLHIKFKDIQIGNIVQFIEYIGGDGLQAHHIKILERHSE